MAMTKTDAFDTMLGELAEAIDAVREGDRDDVINVFEDVLTVLGILNQRLSKLEGEPE